MSLRNRIAGAAAGILVAVSTLSISPQGESMVQQHEGLRQTAYLDAVNIWSICWGSTSAVVPGSTESLEQCRARLRKDLVHAENTVKRLVQVQLTQDQFDALVSFVFNVGAGNFSRSTLLRRINSRQCLAAGQEFSRWVYAKGKKLPGLVRRRAEERELWEGGCSVLV